MTENVVDAARRKLLGWRVNPDEMSPDFEWFVGENFHALQTKQEMRDAGLVPVLEGWKPQQPIIGPETPVLALGSCFARYFILWLGDHGFNRARSTSPYEALIKFDFPFENAAVVAQQFRWAFGKFDSKDAFWIGKDRKRVQPTDETRGLAREALEETEVLIITLGLSEVWYDLVTGEPMWRAVPRSSYDPSRHSFKVLSVAETRAALEEIDAIRREYLPNIKIVYTVSPVRLRATFRPISAITANSASKAIIRAGVDEFLRAHWDEVNKTYFYFPSYEVATELMGEPFWPDMRHLYEHVPQKIMALFAAHYTSLPPDTANLGEESTESDLRRLIGQLESKISELQGVCDERLEVINELDQAARERLEIIHQMDAALRSQTAH